MKILQINIEKIPANAGIFIYINKFFKKMFFLCNIYNGGESKVKLKTYHHEKIIFICPTF